LTFHNISNTISSLFSILSVSCFQKKRTESKRKSFLKTESTHEQLCSSRAKGTKLEPQYKPDTFAGHAEAAIDNLEKQIAQIEIIEIGEDGKLDVLASARSLIIQFSITSLTLMIATLRVAENNTRDSIETLISLGYTREDGAREQITQSNELLRRFQRLNSEEIRRYTQGKQDN